MIELKATVRNGAGIHCRPSTAIVNHVRGYDGAILVRQGSEETDLSSVFGLLTLGLREGDALTVRVDGPGEDTICRELVDLFETHFDFTPRSG